MDINGKKEVLHLKMNPQIDAQIDSKIDKRVQMIYDRYRTGKSIIMDDLRYLWLKDPESGEKLAKSIIEADDTMDKKFKTVNVVNIAYMKKDTEKDNEQTNCNDDIRSNLESSNVISDSRSNNVHEIMSSVKEMLEKMSEEELIGILSNLNEALELKKLANHMKYWEDTFIDKMVVYTYEEEKAFDKLA